MCRSYWFAAIASSILVTSLFGGVEPLADRGEYVFVENTNYRVGLKHNGTYIIGYLDRTGMFTTDRKCAPIKVGESVSGPAFTVLNGDPGTAYEYRSGRLILGQIDKDGTFVPALGSKVISIKDYRPGGNAAPIYNLPGRFVKKGEEKEKGKP
jgi:hypothetical protein